MVDPEKNPEKNSEKKEAAPEKSAIKNVTRQSLHFHVPGGAMRIQPGEITELPSAYLDIAELQSLLQQGHVVELRRTEAKSAPEAAAEAGNEDARRKQKR